MYLQQEKTEQTENHWLSFKTQRTEAEWQFDTLKSGETDGYRESQSRSHWEQMPLELKTGKKHLHGNFDRLQETEYGLV